jgi:signal transduction histidine kinase
MALYQHLLLPIVNVMITSEALLDRRYGALNDEQEECLQPIHSAAIQTYQITRTVLEELNRATPNWEFFTRTFAHDWVAAPSVIISYCDYLRHGMGGDLNALQMQKMERMFYFMHFYLRQLHNVTDYAALQRPLDRKFETLALAQVLHDAVVCVASSVHLEWQMAPNIPPIYGSQHYVQRITENLLANAFAYTTHGQIIVRVRLLGDFVEVGFSDTGRGIPRQYYEHVFLPFFRLEEQQPGAGVGLAVVKGFTERLGGKVRVESDVNHGSTFTMTLPIA